MRIVTWNRDSHGLFDYESRDRDRVQQEYKSNTGVLIQRSAAGDVTLENPFAKDKSPKTKAAAAETEAQAAVGLLKVTRNGKTGEFEVSHGHTIEEVEEASLNRIWRVVGNRND